MYTFFGVLVLMTTFQVSSSFGAAVLHFRNLRCTFAESYLKNALNLYDHYIASKGISFYLYTKDQPPEKLIYVNGLFTVNGFQKSKQTR